MIVPRALAVCGAAVLCGPAAAMADNRLTLEGSLGSVISDDPGVSNKFTIGTSGQNVRFFETEDPAGFTFPIECSPGEVRDGDRVVEVMCPRSRLKAVTLDAGPSEDTLSYTIADLPADIDGGTGADKLTTSDAPDAIEGGQGNDELASGGGDDVVDGGEGADTVDAGAGNDQVIDSAGADRIASGPGDDRLSTADGSADTIDCGEGNDTITIDQLDGATNCETIARREVAAVIDGPAADDKTAPSLAIGGSAVQYVGASRRVVRFVATCSEKGLVQAGAFLDAAGINAKLKSVSAPVAVGGGGAEIRLRLTRAQALAAARGRRSRVRVTVSCVDGAGNTSRPRRFSLRLRRPRT